MTMCTTYIYMVYVRGTVARQQSRERSRHRSIYSRVRTARRGNLHVAAVLNEVDISGAGIG